MTKMNAITFANRKRCISLGRNGKMITVGMYAFNHGDETIALYPMNSKNDAGLGSIEFPYEELDNVIQLLKSVRDAQ